MKNKHNHQTHSYLVRLEKYQQNFALNLVVLAVFGALMVLAHILNWDSSLALAFALVISTTLIFAFRTKSTDVRVELESGVLRIYDLSDTTNADEPELANYEYIIDDLASFRATRSGRWAELLRVVVKTESESTTFVFSTKPSPDADDPLRRLEVVLKTYNT